MAKKFYGLDIRGKNWLQRLASEPVWTAADEGRIIYDEAVEGVKFGTASEWSNAGSYNDVPLNTILLIESDTALTGYTLLTNKDDDVVYVTKGSVAGGDAGGSARGGSEYGDDRPIPAPEQGQSHRGAILYARGVRRHRQAGPRDGLCSWGGGAVRPQQLPC